MTMAPLSGDPAIAEIRKSKWVSGVKPNTPVSEVALRALRGRPITFRPTFLHGTLVGTAANVSSTLAHAAGPIITMYMLPQRMGKGRYVATTVFYYWIGNLSVGVPRPSTGAASGSWLCTLYTGQCPMSCPRHRRCWSRRSAL